MKFALTTAIAALGFLCVLIIMMTCIPDTVNSDTDSPTYKYMRGLSENLISNTDAEIIKEQTDLYAACYFHSRMIIRDTTRSQAIQAAGFIYFGVLYEKGKLEVEVEK